MRVCFLPAVTAFMTEFGFFSTFPASEYWSLMNDPTTFEENPICIVVYFGQRYVWMDQVI